MYFVKKGWFLIFLLILTSPYLSAQRTFSSDPATPGLQVEEMGIDGLSRKSSTGSGDWWQETSRRTSASRDSARGGDILSNPDSTTGGCGSHFI